MRPEDLARDLGIDAKRLRGWLRGRWPRRPEEHGLAWYLTADQIAEARATFAGVQRRDARRVATRGRPAPVVFPGGPVMPMLDASSALGGSWVALQANADAVLASGLKTLTGLHTHGWDRAEVNAAGVYVFSNREAIVYVGESIRVSWRVGQHRDPGSSFMAAIRASGVVDPAAYATSHLSIRSLPVDLGRLELEEFAIACLRPTFNRMRRESRKAYAYDTADPKLWPAVQAESAGLLRAGVPVACDAPTVQWTGMRAPDGAGLYILRDANGRTLYVGETDALGERLGTHAGSRSYFSALRRHVGTEVLGLAFALGVRRGFSPTDESRITGYLATCSIAILPVTFGRWELEREVVHSLRPLLNREHSSV